MAHRGSLGFTWDPRLGRFRAPNGRFVTRDGIRQALDTALDAAGRRAQALGEQLRQGELTVNAWRQGMRAIVTETQLYSTALAKGGWAQLAGSDYGEVSAAVDRQLSFLDRFAADLEARRVAFDGRFVRRLALYAESARATYHQVVAQEERLRGKTQERNVLHLADHCRGRPAGCQEQAARGWVPIGTLLPIGQRLCGPACRCTIQYR